MSNFFDYGHVGNPGELKNVGSDKLKLSFSVGFNRREKEGDEYVNATTWVSVEVWDKQASYLAKKLAKGTPVTVSGQIFLREWTDQEGNKRSQLRIKAERVIPHAKSPVDRAQAPTPPADESTEEPPF